MSNQRYISDELTHFVGRGQMEERQYDLLVKILTEGVLRAGGDPTLEEGHVQLKFRWGQPLSNSELFQPSMVCFCDIPVPDLPIHVQKYSCFGLSFLKSFLIKKGAAPVFYVPKGAPLFNRSRWEWLDRAGEELAQLREVPAGNMPPMPDETALGCFLDYIVLSYLKPFDESVPEDNADNYYMEREWRTLTSVRFRLSDVRRVIIPENYAPRFRDNVPMYTGQVTFAK